MKIKIIFLAVILAIAFGTVFSQSVVITGKKTTYTRKKPIMDFKKTFTINYPKVTASTPALSKKIEAAISYSSILGLNLKDELGETQWLEEADYEVGYNNNGILSITLSMNGSGAYPSGTSKVVVVDLKTGSRVKAADVFTNVSGLATFVRKAQKQEIAKAIAEIKKDPENQDVKPETLFTDARFTAKNLEGFSVDGKGVTFNYDYGFPHVILALQPDGTYSYTWAKLKPYIKPNGLLGRFVR
jgi:hypothetical protein